MLVHLAPGGRSGKHPYGHETAEDYAFVLKGPVALVLGPSATSCVPATRFVSCRGAAPLGERGRSTTRLLFVTLRRR